MPAACCSRDQPPRRTASLGGAQSPREAERDPSRAAAHAGGRHRGAEREPEVRAVIVYARAGSSRPASTSDARGETSRASRRCRSGRSSATCRRRSRDRGDREAGDRCPPSLRARLASSWRSPSTSASPPRTASSGCRGAGRAVPDVGGTTRLVRTVGYARAKELILTARMIRADGRSRWPGDQVVPAGEHLAAAAPRRGGRGERARRRRAREATGRPRQQRRQADLPRDGAPGAERPSPTEDAREGARALAERRPPALHRPVSQPWNVLATALEGRRDALLNRPPPPRPLPARRLSERRRGSRSMIPRLPPRSARRARERSAAATALARIVPIEATVRFEAANAVDTGGRANRALPRPSPPAGSFFVRLERRGFKGRVHTPTFQRDLADRVWRRPSNRAATRPRVDFPRRRAVLGRRNDRRRRPISVSHASSRRAFPFVKTLTARARRT